MQMCGSSSWIIPAGLSLPYIWRLCQCLRTWKDTGNTGQAFNALKYSTAFPVIVLSAVNFQVSDEDWNKFWKPLWLAAALLNSGYSYYWDIERDWEIAFFSSPSGTTSLASCVCNGVHASLYVHMDADCRSEVDGSKEAHLERQTPILTCILPVFDDIKFGFAASMDLQALSSFETESVDSAHFYFVRSFSTISMDIREDRSRATQAAGEQT